MLAVAVPPQWKRQWEDLQVQLRDPFKLRITVVGAIAAVGMLTIYRPLSADIKILGRDVKVAEDRLSLVREIDQLRKVRTKLLENLPPAGDINFWTEHMLAGIRDSGVVLKTLESSYRKTKLGQLQGVYYNLEIQGSFQQIHNLIAWVETNKYFSRVVKLRFKGERSGVEGKLAVAVLVAPELSSIGKSKAAQAAKNEAEKSKAAPPTSAVAGKPATAPSAKTDTKPGLPLQPGNHPAPAGSADGVPGAAGPSTVVPGGSRGKEPSHGA